MNVSLPRHEQLPSLVHESQRLDAQDDDGCWREEVERMQLQLFNQSILWQEKEQGLVSEIHLRDSELTALEHQVRETAKSVEELQKAKDAAEDAATRHAMRADLLQAQLADAVRFAVPARRSRRNQGPRKRTSANQSKQFFSRPWAFEPSFVMAMPYSG